MTEEKRFRYQRIIPALVLALVILGVIIVILDWREVGRVLVEANWWQVLPALAFTAGSYLCLSYGMAAVFSIFRIRLGTRDLLEIGFVSNALNYLLSVGGTIGLSLRFMLMKRRGLSAEDILAPSLFHSYFNNLALFALLPVGLLNILLSHPLSIGSRWGIGTGAVILVILLILATLLVFISKVRIFLLNQLARLWRTITHKEIGPALRDFNNALEKGVITIRRHPISLLRPVLFIIGDWTFSIMALWFCFLSFGTHLGVGTLITGFGAGVTVGLLSLIPGGLGIQEGSMSAVYAGLGVPLEQALLAAVLFRVVYYFVPFLISLAFYRRLLINKN
jgi:uncharacterized protein (TIRG00374 family)